MNVYLLFFDDNSRYCCLANDFGHVLMKSLDISKSNLVKIELLPFKYFE